MGGIGRVNSVYHPSEFCGKLLPHLRNPPQMTTRSPKVPQKKLTDKEVENKVKVIIETNKILLVFLGFLLGFS